ncbi:hypothetical protein RB594_001747 [Gaeumannomyces avenae]
MPAAADDGPTVALSFANNFWGKDDAGVGPLFDRMINAKQTCDELRSFYGARASIEDEYSRKILSLCKKSLGSQETGSLKTSLDTVRGELESIGKQHQYIAAQMKSELEEPLAAFAGAMKERRKIIQNSIEKILKVKIQQTQTVNKTRDKYEQECLKIKGYLAQGHMVMGQEERKNKAKLEKTQISLATSNTEYENAVKALEDTTARWNREWKAAADKFQDLEEERLDFTRGSLWTFANIASTVCVSDDASCEKIRLSLEKLDVEKDIATFITENGTGQEIPGPPKYINFCRGDVDSQSEASDDDNYVVAQFPRSINPAFRTSSPQPSVFESHHDPNNALARELLHGGSGTPPGREQALASQKAALIEKQRQALEVQQQAPRALEIQQQVPRALEIQQPPPQQAKPPYDPNDFAPQHPRLQLRSQEPKQVPPQQPRAPYDPNDFAPQPHRLQLRGQESRQAVPQQQQHELQQHHQQLQRQHQQQQQQLQQLQLRQQQQQQQQQQHLRQHQQPRQAAAPFDANDFTQVPHDPYPMDGMTMLCRTKPNSSDLGCHLGSQIDSQIPSAVSSQLSSARPSSRDDNSEYSNPTSLSDLEGPNGMPSPVKQAPAPLLAERERERERQLERERQMERERHLERERQVERERLEAERKMERERQERERQMERDRQERERQEKERQEREKQEQEQQEKERQELERQERERQDRERQEQEQQRERERQLEKLERERQLVRERQLELEREQQKERERELQRQKEVEQQREREKQLERERELEKQKQLEREREREREQERERERERNNTLKKRSGFFQNSPFRRKSNKDMEQPPSASLRNTWHPSQTSTRAPIAYGASSSQPQQPAEPRAPSPDPIDANASLALNVGQNVFPVAALGRKKEPAASETPEDDPIALALAELKGVTQVGKQSSVRVSADTYHGIATPAPGAQSASRNAPSLRGNDPVAAAMRGTPPPSYDQPVQRLGVPSPACTSRAMKETSQKFVSQTRNLFNQPPAAASPVSSGGGYASASRPGTRGAAEVPRAASPAPPRSASPRPNSRADPQQRSHRSASPNPQPQRSHRSASPNPQQQSHRSVSPNPYASGSERRSQSQHPTHHQPQQQRRPSHAPTVGSTSSRTQARGSEPGYYRHNSPNDMARSASPAPFRNEYSSSRPSSSHVQADMSVQLAPVPDDVYGGGSQYGGSQYGGSQRGRGGRPGTATGSRGMSLYEGAGPVQPARTRSKSVADTSRQYTRDGRPIMHFARALYLYQAAIPEELGFAKGDVLAVLRHQDDGWWEAEIHGGNGQVGLVPSNYLQPC